MTSEQKALLPFACMHRPGCDLDETACQRGAPFDATFIFSRDFYNAGKALGLPVDGTKEEYEDALWKMMEDTDADTV